jgi:hypothetical protein
MIATWMLYALCVSLAAAVAVAALDAAGRSLRLPTRHLWVGGMAACVALSLAGAWRAATAPPPLAAVPTSTSVVAVPREAAAPEGAAALLAAAREAVVGAAASVSAIGDGAGFWALSGGWMALTALLAAAGLITLARFRSGRRGWPRLAIAGIPVRVAPRAGPAVIGIVRPEIVVPAWLLDEPEEHQRIVVLHENEHVRAGDPLLAGMGFALAALMPWNPVMWWLLRGMRWAAEVDCDRRVLRHDVPRRAYGSLLIDVAGRTPRFSLGVSLLSGSSAALERRLQAMTARMPRWPRTRALALSVVSALALVAACESRMPTTSEIEALDATRAEATARQLNVITQDVVYTIDGRVVPAAEARALDPADIATVNIVKGTGATDRIAIVTRDRAAAPQRAADAPAGPVIYTVDGRGASTTVRARAINPADIATVNVVGGTGGADRVSVVTRDGATQTARVGAAPVVVIDGVRRDAAALNALRADQIERVEVLKGDAARALFPEPDASRGVIRVTTRSPQ